MTSAALTLAHGPAALSEAPGRLTIPAINLDTAVVPVGVKPLVIDGKTYGTWEVADNEVGWHNLSAALGQPGNTVLAGHSSAYAKVFRNLKYVKIGNQIMVQSISTGKVRRYIVTERILVQEVGVSLETRIKNAQLIAPTGDERLTLVTCARPGNTHRLIVIAKPVANPS
jgi:sortase A